MPLQQTQGVQIKGRDEAAFATLTPDGAKERLDVSASPAGFSGYVCADVDKTNASYYYYGFTNDSGAWYIMRKATGDPSAYRFVFGSADYTTAWTARSSQTYDYYHEAV